MTGFGSESQYGHGAQGYPPHMGAAPQVNPYAGAPQAPYQQGWYPQPGPYPGAPGGPVSPQMMPHDQRMNPVVPAMFVGGAPYGIDPATGIPYSDKSKVAAGLLQLFLGGFGIGRWYIGTHGVAAGQLVLWFLAFVTSFIFGIGLVLFVGLGIWVLVDAIMIFTGSVRDGDGRVLR